jgi:hypothetical protein
MATFDEIKALQDLNKLIEIEKSKLTDIEDINKRIAYQTEINANNEKIVADSLKLQEESKKDINLLTDKEKQELNDILKTQKSINTELTKEERTRRNLNAAINEFGNKLKQGWKYLMDTDKVIKSTVLNLGLSGTKADLMRSSFEQSAGFVARLGGNLEDIQKVMEGFADETGRARVMSAQMVQDITAIGKGTGLGVEQATKLAAQFELMGIDAKGAMNYVQGVVDTSERMGVNTTKVLKNVSDNFKKLNTYTFQQGVKGMAQMAMYAEKFKIDINDALNAAKVAHSLEGAIDLAAQLQVMGGEFAKTDPFEMLFLSRNDPAKFTEKIADMTKGVVSFRKMSDGTFQKFISPADRDRLAAVAKSLGMEESALTQIAERTAEVQKMRQQMVGMGLSAKDKKLVEGMAIFNTETGKFTVQIGNATKDISKITSADAQILAKQKVSLEDRAKQAQTFEDAFKATIMELKSALMPILRGINSVLTAIRPTVISLTKFFTEGPAAWAKVAALFLGVGIAWKGILQPFLQKMGANTIGKLAGAIRGTGGVGGVTKGVEDVTGGLGKVINPNAGKGLMRGGAGVGAAAAGIGAMGVGVGEGINLAATGISKLADSMSKLTPEQAASLKSIAMTLAITFPIAAIGIAAVGLASAEAAIPILAVGAAMVGVGFGIKLATDGIGKMALGLAEMNKSGGGAGQQLLGVAAGIGAITLAMGAGGIVGMFTFNNSLSRMAKNAPELEKIGNAFANIKAVLSGSKDDFLAIQNVVESIAKLNTKGGSNFAELASLLKNPLKIEFPKGEVALHTNITLDVNGEKFNGAAQTAQFVAVTTKRMKEGKQNT